jgi:hypothetical protein
MTTVTPLIVPGLAMPAIVVPVMMTLPVMGRFLPVTILMLPPLVITMTMPVMVATRATITTTTQHGPSGSADPGTDQLTILAAHLVADGRATQTTQSATYGRLILLAAMGRCRTTQRPADGGAGQGARIAAHLLT